MPDHARSADPAVQFQIDRLMALGPGADVLGLDRITRLLARLGEQFDLGDPDAAALAARLDELADVGLVVRV